jgi:uncharacterized protein YPO0396
MSMTLFNTDAAQSGFRLAYLEIYNWGTFDKNVFRLETGCDTTLLTGANGSGKTTIIDAIITLLVPSNKRFYNQSSGAEAKKERDELSYFWGSYGKSYSEENETAQVEQLRKKEDNPYSVLLACFRNEGLQQDLTLVQVRWYTSAGLRKVFIVSSNALNVNDHFGKGKFDVKGEWRRKLQSQFAKTEVFDSFKDYSTRFSEILGLKEKALSLFNQTVGIKVLGDLTQFVRTQMLDEPDSESQFQQLHDHYTDLLISHKAIQKDEKQLELLQPIMDQKEGLLQLQKEIDEFLRMKDQIRAVINEIEFDVLEMNAREVESAMQLKTAEEIQLTKQLKDQETRRTQLISQKIAFNLEGRLTLLEQQRNAEAEKAFEKQLRFQQYLQSAKQLELNDDINLSSFSENKEYASLLQKELNDKIDSQNFELFSARKSRTDLVEKASDLQSEIESLLQRRNRMPQDLIRARERLMTILDVNEDVLPFAGELIKVKDDCKHWEDAIEKVLHGFSMRLLVPQTYHRQVNAYVNPNNMGTKLVYDRVEDRISGSLKRWPASDDSLLNKLDFKDTGIYRQWLENQLINSFDYHCTDDMDDFFATAKAITSKGLFRNGGRHEKNDRPGWDKTKHRLGWDNRSLIRLLNERKKETEEQISQIGRRIENLGKEVKALEEKRNLTVLILAYSSFDEINYGVHLIEVRRIEAEEEKLKKSNDKFGVIVEELNACGKLISELTDQKTDLLSDIKNLRKTYADQTDKRMKLKFDDITEEGRKSVRSFIETELKTGVMPSTPEAVDKLNLDIFHAVSKKEKRLDENKSRKREAMMQLISAFCRPSVGILTEFPEWQGDVKNIREDPDSILELEDLYSLIRHQRLVEHKKRFTDYMDNSMLDSLTNFRTWLDNEEERIKEVIEELNIPLKKITFNNDPDTYLQLEYKPNKRDPQIKEFKQRLSETIPNIVEYAGRKDEAYRKQVFERIKELIEELKKEELWRRKVTDVRNRLTFNAQEYTVAENKTYRYHDNTNSYSGGQKAQFTYAILGAAIAHQFGIFQTSTQHKSLRFITVDEAFSKLDPEKSRFLMEYCAQLNLQLLVVTPLDKISIAEPFINAVHYTEIKNKKHSVIHNLTMEQYYEKQTAFKELTQNEV